MSRPIYVVVVEKPKMNGSPFVFGPYASHVEASDVRDRYLATEPVLVSHCHVRSLYEPSTLMQSILRAGERAPQKTRFQRTDPRRRTRRTARARRP